jgi:hypothetical protein
MSTAGWESSVVRPLWTLTRIVRSNRRFLERLAIDASVLRTCATDQQGLLIDRCDCRRSATMLDTAAGAIASGVAWVIAATERDQHIITARAGGHQHWVHGGCSWFRDASTWVGRGIRLLLTSVGELRATSTHNLRRRLDTREHFCPFLAVVDPDLTLCERPYGNWDPAWVIRDMMSRICAVQQTVPIIIFTARDLATISPSTVQRSYGLSGLLYCDLAATAGSSVVDGADGVTWGD